MPGLSPKLPLSIDEIDGLATNKDFREVARQNLKMIVLTSPGERIMPADYGVGLRRMLFNPESEVIRELGSKIKSVVIIPIIIHKDIIV